MAKTSYLEIPAGQETLYFGTLQSGDRFTFPRVYLKNSLLSRKKIAAVSQRSFLPMLKDVWSGYNATEKAAWKTADPHPHKNGWRAFVGEMSARIKAGEAGLSSPNNFHNGKVGVLSVEAPATAIKIVQPHPSDYYILKKVTGTRGQYSPLLIEEAFHLPLQISLNYKADLTAQGAGAYAKFYALVKYHYQGLDKFYSLECNLDLSCDWKAATATLTSVATHAVMYSLYFDLYNVRGTLQFDNVQAVHGGVNWARDPYCLNIATSFTKAFYQVPQHWAAVDLPEGAGYGSLFPF